jgi:hypothetical protein
MEILSLEKNKWSVVDPGAGSDLNRDQSVIDVKGKSIYAISRRLRAVLRYSIPSRRIVDSIALPRDTPLPDSADFETHLAFDPINRVLLYPSTRDFGGRVYRFGIYHVDRKRWEWEAVPTAGHPVQGNVVGFDVGNNVMMLYGGKSGSDVEAPSVFWLYRYGNGVEPGAPAR